MFYIKVYQPSTELFRHTAEVKTLTLLYKISKNIFLASKNFNYLIFYNSFSKVSNTFKGKIKQAKVYLAGSKPKVIVMSSGVDNFLRDNQHMHWTSIFCNTIYLVLGTKAKNISNMYAMEFSSMIPT